jgi:hypothetical protein
MDVVELPISKVPDNVAGKMVVLAVVVAVNDLSVFTANVYVMAGVLDAGAVLTITKVFGWVDVLMVCDPTYLSSARTERLGISNVARRLSDEFVSLTSEY